MMNLKMKQNILTISLILNFFMISIIFILYIKLEPNNTKKQQQQQSKHVFFDLGANKGDSAENFLGVLDKAISGNDIKKVVPANKLKENWIMYLIEGNSKFDQSLLDLKNKYSNKQHEIIVYN